jgi:hypothetical protein
MAVTQLVEDTHGLTERDDCLIEPTRLPHDVAQVGQRMALALAVTQLMEDAHSVAKRDDRLIEPAYLGQGPGKVGQRLALALAIAEAPVQPQPRSTANQWTHQSPQVAAARRNSPELLDHLSQLVSPG